MSDWVSVKPLKEKFLENEATNGRGYASEICFILDWRSSKDTADTSRLKRALGITSRSPGKYSTQIDYDKAVKICRAMGTDPIDVDL